MATISAENVLIIKAVKWALSVSREIEKAGGSPPSVLSKFNDDAIITFVRNDLHLTYKEPNNG